MPTIRLVIVFVLVCSVLAACTPAVTTGTHTPPPAATAQIDATAAPAVPVLPAAVRAVQQRLADALGLPADQITLTELTVVDWPDACLGAARPDEMCATVITPGYRLVFDTPQGPYVIHSDLTGGSYRLVAPPLDSTPSPVVTVPAAGPSAEPPVLSASGIQGQVFIGPACPGPVSIDSPCPNQPFQATLTIRTPQNERVGQVTTDANGQFRLGLPAGSYIVHPEPPKEGIAYAQDQPVDVRAGEFTSIEIVYDSGIR